MLVFTKGSNSVKRYSFDRKVLQMSGATISLTAISKRLLQEHDKEIAKNKPHLVVIGLRQTSQSLDFKVDFSQLLQTVC